MFYDERVDSLGGRVVESTLIERVVFPILETRGHVRRRDTPFREGVSGRGRFPG